LETERSQSRGDAAIDCVEHGFGCGRGRVPIANEARSDQVVGPSRFAYLSQSNAHRTEIGGRYCTQVEFGQPARQVLDCPQCRLSHYPRPVVGVSDAFGGSFVNLAREADRDRDPNAVAVHGLVDGGKKWALWFGRAHRLARLGDDSRRRVATLGGSFGLQLLGGRRCRVIKEFKEFINRGNLVDIAVAFVLGVAFASVIDTLTTRIVSPLIAMIFDLSGLASMGTFGPVDAETGLPVGSVGALVEAILNFLIVGFVVFLVVRAYNRFQRTEPEPAPEPDTEDIVLLRRIAASLDRN
jgi:large conductance mechanosensitive channel